MFRESSLKVEASRAESQFRGTNKSRNLCPKVAASRTGGTTNTTTQGVELTTGEETLGIILG
jgi:hypothetical protein